MPREHVNPGRVSAEKRCDSIRNASVFKRRCEDFLCSPDQDESLYGEREAEIHALNAMEPLTLEGIVVLVDGKVNAFAISSRLS